MNYIAYLHKEKDSDFGVSFPDFPGCITAGKSLQEAYRMAEEALSFHIRGMLDDGEAVPAPSTIDQVDGDPSRRDGIVALIHAVIPGKVVRFNVTAQESQLDEINRLARDHGMNRSAYLVHAALNNQPATASSTQKQPTIQSQRQSNSHRN